MTTATNGKARSNPAPRCHCNMYKHKGTCYHTGYKPTFHDQSKPLLSEGHMHVLKSSADFLKAYEEKYGKRS